MVSKEVGYADFRRDDQLLNLPFSGLFSFYFDGQTMSPMTPPLLGHGDGEVISSFSIWKWKTRMMDLLHKLRKVVIRDKPDDVSEEDWDGRIFILALVGAGVTNDII